MADSTLTRLVQLIGAAESPELRQAAIRVAGSLGSGKDRVLVQVLLHALDDPAPELRCTAIASLGLLHVEEILPRLEAFVRQGGEELEPAVQAASLLGARGSRLMDRILHEATPSQRSRIAAVLAKSGTGKAVVVTAHALLDADSKVVAAAARSLAAEVPNFTPAQKHALAHSLLDSLEGKDKLPVQTEAAMVRVLGTLHDARAEEIFWSRLAPSCPHDIRVAALQALGSAPAAPKPPGRFSDTRLHRLLTCTADGDFQIVASALMLLKDVPVPGKKFKPWLKLLEAPDVAARRFAVDKLRGLESKDWAQALLAQVDHPDRALREEVLAVLCSFTAGRDALLEKLLATPAVEECWSLARALAPNFRETSAAQRTLIFKEACAYQDQEDRRAAPLWFLLRELDVKWTKDSIEQRADALRRKKNYAAALAYYRLLGQDPACSEDIRFDLAATGLKTSAHDLSLEARQRDPSLIHFGRLLEDPAFDLIGHISKAKWLDPPDLFYLGFHFVEQNHRARDFGKEVLELLAKRSPRSELGKNAKRKLKSEALV
jgi:hypothetical protein